jgi:nucleoid-associated protein YgaU
MDVRNHTNKILDLMKVKAAGGARKKERPDWVRFCWGQDLEGFPAVITSVTQNFTLFLPTGIPVRAILDVTFQQIENVKTFLAQNPTSGGSAGRSTHVVAAGETLDLIAFQELGDAKEWRRLAEVNGITDPLRLVPGSVLTVEPED